MENQQITKTKALVECALLIAIGTILAQIKLFKMPMGGGVTALSMLPFVLISFRHGTKWGVLAGFANSLLQMALGGIYTPPAGTAAALIGSILLDYVLAYTCIGFAEAVGRPLAKNHPLGAIITGTAVVCVIRFLCSFISGFLIWASITEDGMGAVIYSLAYNGSYMLPETILTVLGAIALYKAAPRFFSALK